MKRVLLSKLVDRFERTLGVELPYLRSIVEDAPGALLPIALSMPAAAYGSHVPAPVLHMVRLGATRAQDCGECLQIAVNLALRDGVDGFDVMAVLKRDHSSVPVEYVDAYEFGLRIGTGSDGVQYREALRGRYGERGLIEASVAAASAQFFPVLKRAMGMAQSCDLDAVRVDAPEVRAA